MHRQAGFTLIEIALALVIIGLLMSATVRGQELITGTRVRNLIAQQDAVKVAYFVFQDRYRAYPGDYAQATQSIPGVSGSGDGDGKIEPATGNGNNGNVNGNGNNGNGNNGNGNGNGNANGSNGNGNGNGNGGNGNGNGNGNGSNAHGNGNNGNNGNGNNGNAGNGSGNVGSASGTPSEQLLVWDHLSHAGVLTGTYSASGATAASPATTPMNPYNVLLDLVHDDGYHGNGVVVPRHNLKTGAGIPVDILAELDRKIDDGNAATGAFRGSTSQGAAGANQCWDGVGNWLTASGQPNCGGANLL